GREHERLRVPGVRRGGRDLRPRRRRDGRQGRGGTAAGADPDRRPHPRGGRPRSPGRARVAGVAARADLPRARGRARGAARRPRGDAGQRARVSRSVQILASLLISAAALWFSVHGVDVGTFWTDLGHARLFWLGPMIFFAWAALWLRALRWRVLLEGV